MRIEELILSDVSLTRGREVKILIRLFVAFDAFSSVSWILDVVVLK